MPMLSLIWFWPAGGRLIDREEDAFVRSAGRIGALYSDAIARQRQPAKYTELRWAAHHERPVGQPTVHVHLDEPTEGFDIATVDLPDGIADLPPADRGALVAGVIHTGLVALHTTRGWSLDAIETAHAEVVASGGEFVSAAEWKTSPGRRWRARAVYRLDDDGDGRSHIEAETLPAPDGRVWRSAELVDSAMYDGFRRWTRVRWTSAHTVQLTTSPRGPGIQEQDTILLDVELPPSPPPTAPALEALPQPPKGSVAVRVHGGSVDVSPPEARIGGGGPTNDVPAAYLEAGYLLSHWVEDELLGWWSTGSVNLWENLWDFSPSKTTKPFVRLTGHRLTTRIRHPMPDPAADADPVAQARHDMLTLLDAVRRRLDLPPPPANLPGADDLRVEVEDLLARQEQEDRQLIGLIGGLNGRLPKWLTRGLIRAVNDGTSGDAINGLHINLTVYDVVLTDDEQHLWQQLSHQHTDG